MRARMRATPRDQPHFLAADAPALRLANHGGQALEWNATQGLAYVTTSATHPTLKPPGARPPEAVGAGRSRLSEI